MTRPSEPPLSAGWQDISTAPDEEEPWGGTFLAYAPHAMGGYCLIAARNLDGVIVDTLGGEQHPFTHWMPLPSPPADTTLSGPQRSEVALSAQDHPPSSVGGEGEAVAWRCLNAHGDAFLTEHANGAYFWAKSGKPVQPLYLHPSPETGEISRETLARIIDPEAWGQAAGFWTRDPDHAAVLVAPSLAKADAILSKLNIDEGLLGEGDRGLARSQPGSDAQERSPVPPLSDGPRNPEQLRARDLTDAELIVEQTRVEKLWDSMFEPDENGDVFEGHGGSPGEWMTERMDEVATEQQRRASIAPQNSEGGRV